MIQLAYGLPGAGKSLLFHDKVAAQADCQVFFVKDWDVSWGPDGILWRGNPPPNIHIVNDPKEIQADVEPGVYVFRFAEPLAIARRAIDIGDVVYVDDELDLSARRKGWESSPLRVFVHQGRHALNEKGEPCPIHLLGACRRPQNLHTDITELASEFYMFRLMGQRTLQRLEGDGLIEGIDWERIRDQPVCNFLHWPSHEWLSIPMLNVPPQSEEDNGRGNQD